jgi:NitT/TauT family transport system substrate-binding protein
VKRRAFVAALVAAPVAGRAQTPPRVAVRVGGTPNDDMTPVVYAQRTGMFERAGLDAVVEKGLNGSAVAAAVASGSYDIGKSVISALLDAHEKGLPFRIVAPSSIEDIHRPYGGLIFLRDAAVRSGKDLEGQTIALGSLGSIGRVALPAWMDQHGGDGSTIKFVEVPFSAVPAAVEQRRVFAGEITYPNLGAAMATGRFSFIPIYGAIASRFIGGVFYTTASFSDAHPDAIRAFARTYYDAARYTNAHPSATAAMMADFTGLPVDAIASMRRVQSAVELDPAQIQPTIALYAKYGLLKKAFPARDLIDERVPVR